MIQSPSYYKHAVLLIFPYEKQWKILIDVVFLRSLWVKSSLDCLQTIIAGSFLGTCKVWALFNKQKSFEWRKVNFSEKSKAVTKKLQNIVFLTAHDEFDQETDNVKCFYLHLTFTNIFFLFDKLYVRKNLHFDRKLKHSSHNHIADSKTIVNTVKRLLYSVSHSLFFENMFVMKTSFT